MKSRLMPGLIGRVEGLWRLLAVGFALLAADRHSTLTKQLYFLKVPLQVRVLRTERATAKAIPS